MQTLIDRHKEILERDIRFYPREIFKQIDWSQRLIAIKGTRGSGKTTTLLHYARKQSQADEKSCLYVDMNNLYFAQHTLISFVDEFYKKGGKTLLLDQINKYPNWGKELNYCYEHYSDLQIVFAGSSLLRLDSPKELKHRIAPYSLSGLSFREFINHESGKDYPAYSLEDIIENHEEIVLDILKDVRPLAYLSDYMRKGFYPFYFESKDRYSQKLLKFINLILEVDITYLNQIEIKYIHKLRKLLYNLADMAPLQPNVSKLSSEVEVSRATIMNYLHYLQEAELIHLLHAPNGDAMKKPQQVFLNNPNLIFSIAPWNASETHLRKTFFYSQLNCKHQVESSATGDFFIDSTYHFFIGDKDSRLHKNAGVGTYLAADMIELGLGKKIPLWLFGFLY